MNREIQYVLAALLSAAIFGLTGCPFKKSKPPVPPPTAQAPTATETAPQAPPQPQPQAQTPATPTTGEEKSAEAEQKPKPKPKTTHTAKKPPAPAQAGPKPETKPEEKPTQQATAKPPKIIIQEGGVAASGGQLSAPTGHDEASHRRQTTAQLLDSTEANLRSLKRPLNADEQSMLAQIKDYMEQSRIATAEDDLVRAHNLALKAHLLSDELAKP